MRAPEVFGGEVLKLQVGSHCAIEDDDGPGWVVEALEEGTIGHGLIFLTLSILMK
ncbi:hypothetical protein OSCI_2110008 [Kamptonema sp. PCC 6506]|nr:hypothetical protein OSCI_2110008 [Kamptonema sp. PCC 6506]